MLTTSYTSSRNTIASADSSESVIAEVMLEADTLKQRVNAQERQISTLNMQLQIERDKGACIQTTLDGMGPKLKRARDESASLQKIKDELSSQMTERNKRIREMSVQLQEQQRKENELRQQLGRQERKMRQLQSQCDELPRVRDELQQARVANGKLRDALSEAERSCAVAKHKQERDTKEIASLRKELKRLKTSVSDLTAENERSRKEFSVQLRQATEERSVIGVSAMNLVNASTARLDEWDEYQQINNTTSKQHALEDQLRADLEREREQTSSLTIQVTQLNYEVTKLQHEAQSVQQQLSEVSKAKQDLMDRCDADARESNRTLLELRNSLSFSEGQLRTMREKADFVEGRFLEQERRITALSTQCEQQAARLKIVEKEHTQRTRDATLTEGKLKSALEVAEKEVVRLRQSRDHEHDSVRDLEVSMRDFRTQLEGRNSVNKRLESQVDALEAKLDHSQQRVAELERTNAEWRAANEFFDKQLKKTLQENEVLTTRWNEMAQTLSTYLTLPNHSKERPRHHKRLMSMAMGVDVPLEFVNNAATTTTTTTTRTSRKTNSFPRENSDGVVAVSTVAEEPEAQDTQEDAETLARSNDAVMKQLNMIYQELQSLREATNEVHNMVGCSGKEEVAGAVVVESGEQFVETTVEEPQEFPIRIERMKSEPEVQPITIHTEEVEADEALVVVESDAADTVMDDVQFVHFETAEPEVHVSPSVVSMQAVVEQPKGGNLFTRMSRLEECVHTAIGRLEQHTTSVLNALNKETTARDDEAPLVSVNERLDVLLARFDASMGVHQQIRSVYEELTRLSVLVKENSVVDVKTAVQELLSSVRMSAATLSNVHTVVQEILTGVSADDQHSSNVDARVEHLESTHSSILKEAQSVERIHEEIHSNHEHLSSIEQLVQDLSVHAERHTSALTSVEGGVREVLSSNESVENLSSIVKQQSATLAEIHSVVQGVMSCVRHEQQQQPPPTVDANQQAVFEELSSNSQHQSAVLSQMEETLKHLSTAVVEPQQRLQEQQQQEQQQQQHSAVLECILEKLDTLVDKATVGSGDGDDNDTVVTTKNDENERIFEQLNNVLLRLQQHREASNSDTEKVLNAISATTHVQQVFDRLNEIASSSATSNVGVVEELERRVSELVTSSRVSEEVLSRVDENTKANHEALVSVVNESSGETRDTIEQLRALVDKQTNLITKLCAHIYVNGDDNDNADNQEDNTWCIRNELNALRESVGRHQSQNGALLKKLHAQLCNDDESWRLWSSMEHLTQTQVESKRYIWELWQQIGTEDSPLSLTLRDVQSRLGSLVKQFSSSSWHQPIVDDTIAETQRLFHDSWIQVMQDMKTIWQSSAVGGRERQANDFDEDGEEDDNLSPLLDCLKDMQAEMQTLMTNSDVTPSPSLSDLRALAANSSSASTALASVQQQPIQVQLEQQLLNGENDRYSLSPLILLWGILGGFVAGMHTWGTTMMQQPQTYYTV